MCSSPPDAAGSLAVTAMGKDVFIYLFIRLFICLFNDVLSMQPSTKVPFLFFIADVLREQYEPRLNVIHFTL